MFISNNIHFKWETTTQILPKHNLNKNGESYKLKEMLSLGKIKEIPNTKFFNIESDRKNPILMKIFIIFVKTVLSLSMLSVSNKMDSLAPWITPQVLNN